MNAKKLACAPVDIDIHELWSKIDWNKCERFVQKLQARIVKAQREGRHNKVKALQWMLTHSFYAKTLAVKRVTTKTCEYQKEEREITPTRNTNDERPCDAGIILNGS